MGIFTKKKVALYKQKKVHSMSVLKKQKRNGEDPKNLRQTNNAIILL